jgi:septum formation protein
LNYAIVSGVHLVLASASPRRADLLRAAGFTFEIRVADVDETRHDGEDAATYVRRLAAEKSDHIVAQGFSPAVAGLTASAKATASLAEAARRRKACATTLEAGATTEEAVVIGADTVVVVDGEILGKPRDDDDAAAMLRRLAGRRHEVLTGVSIRANGRETGRVETSAVYFAELEPVEMAWYVASGEGRDKAGAYAVQGLASRFILKIDGSYSNVVGLPVAVVHQLLKGLGVNYSLR